MLVLTRRLDEEVVITTPTGEEIVILVARFPQPGRVSLGITAPPAMAITRREPA